MTENKPVAFQTKDGMLRIEQSNTRWIESDTVKEVKE